MKELIINEVLASMSCTLDVEQLKTLQYQLSMILRDVDIVPTKQTLTTELCDNSKLIKNYLVCKKIANAANNTLQSYYYRITQFVTFINGNSLLDCDTFTFRYYFAYLENEGNSPVTVDNVRRILKAFYQWLVDEEYLNRNPITKIPKIQQPIRIQHFYTEDEMQRVRSACKSWREVAIVEFLLSTGLRISEVVNVKFSEINFQEGYFRVIGKGDKERYAFLNQKAIHAIVLYIRERNQMGIVSPYLFTSSRGTVNGALSVEAFNKILHEIGSRVGLYDLTCHCFRRYFAQVLANNNVPQTVIVLLLGHSDFKTTYQYYLPQQIDVAREAVGKFT